MVIGIGAFYVNPANWHPFAPFGYTGVSFFGHTLWGQTAKGGEPLGMIAGAAIIFFAYIGFDSVSVHSEEARKPASDHPSLPSADYAFPAMPRAMADRAGNDDFQKMLDDFAQQAATAPGGLEGLLGG